MNTFINANDTESLKDIKQCGSGLGIANYRVYWLQTLKRFILRH